MATLVIKHIGSTDQSNDSLPNSVLYNQEANPIGNGCQVWLDKNNDPAIPSEAFGLLVGDYDIASASWDLFGPDQGLPPTNLTPLVPPNGGSFVNPQIFTPGIPGRWLIRLNATVWVDPGGGNPPVLNPNGPDEFTVLLEIYDPNVLGSENPENPGATIEEQKSTSIIAANETTEYDADEGWSRSVERYLSTLSKMLGGRRIMSGQYGGGPVLGIGSTVTITVGAGTSTLKRWMNSDASLEEFQNFNFQYKSALATEDLSDIPIFLTLYDAVPVEGRSYLLVDGLIPYDTSTINNGNPAASGDPVYVSDGGELTTDIAQATFPRVVGRVIGDPNSDTPVADFPGVVWFNGSGNMIPGLMTGPATSTDEHIVRWDGATGDKLKDSIVHLDESVGGQARLVTPGNESIVLQPSGVINNALIVTDSDDTPGLPNVGINTADPEAFLHIEGDATNDQPLFMLSEGATNRWQLEADFSASANPVHCKSGAIPNIMTWQTTAKGRIGIGTTVPQTKLHIKHAGAAGGDVNGEPVALTLEATSTTSIFPNIGSRLILKAHSDAGNNENGCRIEFGDDTQALSGFIHYQNKGLPNNHTGDEMHFGVSKILGALLTPLVLNGFGAGVTSNLGAPYAADASHAFKVNGDSHFDGDLEITGKLTVAGLIDPTGLEFAPRQAGNPGVTADTLWVTNGNILGNSGDLYFGTLNITQGLGGGGGGLWTANANGIHYAAGNVGVGVTLPDTQLHMAGTLTIAPLVGVLDARIETPNSTGAPFTNINGPTLFIETGGPWGNADSGRLSIKTGDTSVVAAGSGVIDITTGNANTLPSGNLNLKTGDYGAPGAGLLGTGHIAIETGSMSSGVASTDSGNIEIKTGTGGMISGSINIATGDTKQPGQTGHITIDATTNVVSGAAGDVTISGELVKLIPGTGAGVANEVFTSDAAGNGTWQAQAGGGNVSGPLGGAPVTNHALARWDGTSGTLLENNSNVTSSDTGTITCTGLYTGLSGYVRTDIIRVADSFGGGPAIGDVLTCWHANGSGRWEAPAGGGGAQNLFQVLTVGDETGGENIILTDIGGVFSEIRTPNVGAGPSGPIVIKTGASVGVGGVAGDVTLQGGNGDFAGGNISLITGGNPITGTCGNLNLKASGAPPIVGPDPTPGEVFITAGDANPESEKSGGGITLQAGWADRQPQSTNVISGFVKISAGNLEPGTWANMFPITGGPVDILGGEGKDGGGPVNIVGGATVANAGGTVNITGGESDQDDGGAVNITGGVSDGANDVGGDVHIHGGLSNPGQSGGGGQVHLVGGVGDQQGGQVSVEGGSGFLGGPVEILAGNSASAGPGGNINIGGGSGNSGGDVAVIGGESVGAGSGGGVTIGGGQTNGMGSPGGALHLKGGISTPGMMGPGGEVIISSGAGDTQGGDIKIQAGIATNANQGGNIQIACGVLGGAASAIPGSVAIIGGTSANTSGNAGGTAALSGGAGDAAGGDVSIKGGAGDAYGNGPQPGGRVLMLAGPGTSAGGALEAYAGDGDDDGGDVIIKAGDGVNVGGGNATFSGGIGGVAGFGGNVGVFGGAASVGMPGGAAQLSGGDGMEGGAVTIRGGTAVALFGGNVLIDQADGIGGLGEIKIGDNNTFGTGANVMRWKDDMIGINCDPSDLAVTPAFKIAAATNRLSIDGDMTVTGVVDPIGVYITPQAVNPVGPARYPAIGASTAPDSTLWVDSGTGSLMLGNNAVGGEGTWQAALNCSVYNWSENGPTWADGGLPQSTLNGIGGAYTTHFATFGAHSDSDGTHHGQSAVMPFACEIIGVTYRYNSAQSHQTSEGTVILRVGVLDETWFGAGSNNISSIPQDLTDATDWTGFATNGNAPPSGPGFGPGNETWVEWTTGDHFPQTVLYPTPVPVDAGQSILMQAISVSAAVPHAEVSCVIWLRGTTGGPPASSGGGDIRITNVDLSDFPNYNVLTTDEFIAVDLTSIGGPMNINLPNAFDKTGRVITIKDQVGLVPGESLTVTAEVGQLIDGDPAKTYTNPFQVISFVSDGTNWMIL
jgi:hypothetical protein